MNDIVVESAKIRRSKNKSWYNPELHRTKFVNIKVSAQKNKIKLHETTWQVMKSDNMQIQSWLEVLALNVPSQRVPRESFPQNCILTFLMFFFYHFRLIRLRKEMWWEQRRRLNIEWWNGSVWSSTGCDWAGCSEEKWCEFWQPAQMASRWVQGTSAQNFWESWSILSFPIQPSEIKLF